MLDGKKIAKIRAEVEASGRTVKDLCKVAGINHVTWYRWEKGEHLASGRLEKKLRDALDDMGLGGAV